MVACDLDAFKLLALYDRDLAVSAINKVLGLHASVSRSITGSLPPLRDLLVSGSPLPWAAPACAGPMLTLMYRQLALRHTSADDFEAGISLALLHIDGKYLKDVQPNMKNAALWFVSALLKKRWSDDRVFALSVLLEHLSGGIRGRIDKAFFVNLGRQQGECATASPMTAVQKVIAELVAAHVAPAGSQATAAVTAAPGSGQLRGASRPDRQDGRGGRGGRCGRGAAPVERNSAQQSRSQIRAAMSDFLQSAGGHSDSPSPVSKAGSISGESCVVGSPSQLPPSPSELSDDDDAMALVPFVEPAEVEAEGAEAPKKRRRAGAGPKVVFCGKMEHCELGADAAKRWFFHSYGECPEDKSAFDLAKRTHAGYSMDIHKATDCLVELDPAEHSVVYCKKCDRSVGKCCKKEQFIRLTKETARKVAAWRPYLPAHLPDRMWVRCENGLRHKGGKSHSQINLGKKLLKRKMADSTEDPSTLVMDAYDSSAVDNDYVPDEAAVSKERSRMKTKEALLENTGDSPEELERLCAAWAEADDQPPWKPWVHLPRVSTNQKQTFVPYTTDYYLSSAYTYIEEGRSIYKRARFLIMCGDYTHNETKDLLKKLMLGLAGKHFPHKVGEWRSTLLPVLLAIASQEGFDPMVLAIETLDEIFFERFKYYFSDVLEVLFWDGEAGALSAFKLRYPDVKVVYCLQHARGNIADRCTGGWGQQIKWMIDMIAFNPPAVFHHSIELLLEKLWENDRFECYRYLVDTTAPSVAKLMVINGVWFAKWNTSWTVVPYGFSGYLNNCPEARWRAEDVLDGPTFNMRTSSAFKRCAKHTKTWYEKKVLQQIRHRPSGENEFQPSLMRGEGLWARKVSLYNARYRRFTVEKMQRIHASGVPFIVEVKGPRGPFVQVWVLPKRKQEDFCERPMLQFAELWFSRDAETAGRHYPVNPVGRKSLGALRKMMASYSIIGRRRDNTFEDLHRDGGVRFVTETAFFMRLVYGKEDLGSLHGVPRQLNAKQRAKSTSMRARKSRRIKRKLMDMCETTSGEESDEPEKVVANAAVRKHVPALLDCPGAGAIVATPGSDRKDGPGERSLG